MNLTLDRNISRKPDPAGWPDSGCYPGEYPADIRRGWWEVEERAALALATALWVWYCGLPAGSPLLHLSLLEGGEGRGDSLTQG